MSKTKTIGITVRLQPPLHKKLAARAEAEGRSISQEVIRLLQERLDFLDFGGQQKLDNVYGRVQELTDTINKVLLPSLMELKTKAEGKPRRKRTKAATVADVAKQPAGME